LQAEVFSFLLELQIQAAAVKAEFLAPLIPEQAGQVAVDGKAEIVAAPAFRLQLEVDHRFFQGDPVGGKGGQGLMKPELTTVDLDVVSGGAPIVPAVEVDFIPKGRAAAQIKGDPLPRYPHPAVDLVQLTGLNVTLGEGGGPGKFQGAELDFNISAQQGGMGDGIFPGRCRVVRNGRRGSSQGGGVDGDSRLVQDEPGRTRTQAEKGGPGRINMKFRYADPEMGVFHRHLPNHQMGHGQPAPVEAVNGDLAPQANAQLAGDFILHPLLPQQMRHQQHHPPAGKQQKQDQERNDFPLGHQPFTLKVRLRRGDVFA